MYFGSNEKLNKLVNYIEENITEPISYEKLARILAVNEYTLHRIFLFVTNMSIPEYIRKRRMTLAATDLIKSELKIVDIAVKYQYDSATSFARAFKKIMGFNPSDIKNNKNLIKAFPVLKFEHISEETKNIEYKEIQNYSIILYGVGRKMKIKDIPKEAPGLWKEQISSNEELFEQTQYGVVEYNNVSVEETDEAIYYVCTTKDFEGSKMIEIRNKNYLVFKLNSQNSEEISEFTKKMYNLIIFDLKYNIDNSPDIEEYIGNDTYIYIAIKK